jgi:hypothetical protein
MSDFQNLHPWAIEIRKKIPIYGQKSECLQIPLKQWKTEKDNFLQFLFKIRKRNADKSVRRIA